MNMSLYVIDDEYLVRLGIRETIEWEKYGFSVVGEASDGKHALDEVLRLKPDVILTDIRMPFMDGLEFMRLIREKGLDSKVVVLSGYAEFEYAKSALDNGASSYLLKPIDNDKLIRIVTRLGKEITQQRKKQEQYDGLKEGIPVLREKFFQDLLGGKYEDQDVIQGKSRLLGITHEGNHLVILIRMDHEAGLSDAVPRDPRVPGSPTGGEDSFVENLLTRQVPDIWSRDGMLIPWKPGQWMILLSVSNPSDSTISHVKKKCLEMIGELENACNTSFSVGISGICRAWTDLPLGSRQANEASEVKWMPGINSVVSYEEMDDTDSRGDRSGCHREIRSALEYIRDHYSEDITIEDTAEAVYLSPNYLMHLFRSELGRTFNQCLTGYRMEMARKLLKNPKYRINQVSGMVGYQDAKYFSQLFRKATGMLPKDYMRQK